ncbi:sugar phosphate isomerase/epimerase [Nocardioides daphniae]|uniref:sugar phosphate isomerase/epimerase family protein n=1 Tax=Nocardioides daphniae TaxID=402297 RepID=UPI002688A610
MAITVGLSTVSIYPESTAAGFAYAAQVGYDAVEVMVGMDGVAQQTAALKQLSDHHEMPVCAVHAPCLLWTQRVWGTEPWGKLHRSAALAHALGAPTVVVHPPFRWQKEYAARFEEGIAGLEESTGLHFAVENMYPWRATAGKRGVTAGGMYLPHWDPSSGSFAHTTIDISHAAIAGDDVIEMAQRMGSRLQHVHLTDGTGSAKDEHLVPAAGPWGRTSSCSTSSRRASTARWCWRSTPAAAPARRSGSPTCASRWSSRVRTSVRRPPRAEPRAEPAPSRQRSSCVIVRVSPSTVTVASAPLTSGR